MEGKPLCFIVMVMATTVGTLINGQHAPIFLFEEGAAGVVPCVPRGQATTFFWKRGEWYNVSKEIAYNVNGVPGPDTEKYHVFSNGSLLISNITVLDEGNYHCRIASDHTECHGSVTVYLKVLTTNILPYIDRCSPSTSCTLYEKLSSVTFLTCTATQVSPDMSLKWFNESKEILNGVAVREDKNDLNETIISSTVKIKYENPCFLTCQADSVKMEKAFAHVQLQSESAHRSPAGLIVVTVVLAVICVAVTGFLLHIVIKSRTKVDNKSGKAEQGVNVSDESVPLQKEPEKQPSGAEEDHTKKLSELQEQLSVEQSRTQELEKKLSTEKGKLLKEEEIKRELTRKLEAKEEELKKLNLQQEKLKLVNLQGKGQETKFNEQINNLFQRIEERDQKLQVATNELHSTQDSLTSMKNQMQDKHNELQSTKDTLQEMQGRLKVLQKTIQEKDETLKAANIRIQDKENKLETLQKILQDKEKTLKVSQNTLQEKEEKLKEANNTIQEKEKKLEVSQKILQDTKEKLKDSLRSHESSKRQLRAKVLEVKDNLSTFCRVKRARRSRDYIFSRTGETTLRVFNTECNYSFIYPDNATKADVFTHIEVLFRLKKPITDLKVLLNGIDGGHSTLLVHGNSPESTSYLMYDSDNAIDEGIVLRAIRKIFKTSKEWRNIGYEAEVSASFAKSYLGADTKFTFLSVDGKGQKVMNNHDLHVKPIMVSVESEEGAISFLKMGTQKGTKPDGTPVVTNDFVHFFIKTKFESKEISAGTLTFVLCNNVEAMKDCFKDTNKALFPRFFSSEINAEGSKIVILCNIDEEKKEDAKEHLKFTNWINKEKSTFRLFREKIGITK